MPTSCTVRAGYLNYRDKRPSARVAPSEDYVHLSLRCAINGAVLITPHQARKLFEAGLRMCDELEGGAK